MGEQGVLCPKRAHALGRSTWRLPLPEHWRHGARRLRSTMTKPTSPATETLPTDSVAAASATAMPKTSIRQRLERLFADFGTVAIVTYFVIFFGTWAGFLAAITFGVEIEGVAAGAGSIGAAWLATKVTQPLRIGATLLLTPIVARVWHRMRPRASRVVAVSDPGRARRDGQ